MAMESVMMWGLNAGCSSCELHKKGHKMIKKLMDYMVRKRKRAIRRKTMQGLSPKQFAELARHLYDEGLIGPDLKPKELQK